MNIQSSDEQGIGYRRIPTTLEQSISSKIPRHFDCSYRGVNDSIPFSIEDKDSDVPISKIPQTQQRIPNAVLYTPLQTNNQVVFIQGE